MEKFINIVVIPTLILFLCIYEYTQDFEHIKLLGKLLLVIIIWVLNDPLPGMEQ